MEIVFVGECEVFVCLCFCCCLLFFPLGREAHIMVFNHQKTGFR